MNALGVEAATILPPQPLVVAIDRGERRVIVDALPVDSARDNQEV